MFAGGDNQAGTTPSTYRETPTKIATGETQMKTAALVVCLSMVVLGCGSGNMVNVTKNVVMKGGQWEYVVTPNSSGAALNFEANVPGTNLQFNGTNAMIFDSSQVGLTGPTTMPIFCSPFAVNGEINGNVVKGNFDWGDTSQRFASFSGELAADGQSLSNGAYSGQTCSVDDGPGTPKPDFKGTLTGNIIAPVNGTYSGKLTSSLFGADVVTFAITQNPDFSLNISGTSVENGVTTMFASLPQSQVPAAASLGAVTGASVLWGGTAENVNGSQSFSFSGHLNPTATQLTVTLFQVGPNETATGTLARQ
jgi:hypothetical protein